MSQTRLITHALKKLLKAHGIRYKDVADRLGLSLASVKRLFVQGNFTIERLERICQLMNIDLSDLFNHVRKTKKITQLSEHQEQTIVSDVKLLLVATCVVNQWSLADILAHYKLSYSECIQKLYFLDKINIIEMLPKDRFKLKISPNFSWRANGPIQKFFQNHLQDDFLQSTFTKQDETFALKFGMLSKKSTIILDKKLQEVADLYTELSLEDSAKKIHERSRSALLLVLRPWAPKLFEQYKK